MRSKHCVALSKLRVSLALGLRYNSTKDLPIATTDMGKKAFQLWKDFQDETEMIQRL